MATHIIDGDVPDPLDLSTHRKPMMSTMHDVEDVIPKAPTQKVIPPMDAPFLLESAAGHIRDRASTYDKEQKAERSMARTVAVFNAYHDTKLTEAQGWHLMQILKDVRLFSNIEKPHRDSIEDGIAYAALKGESLLSK